MKKISCENCNNDLFHITISEIHGGNSAAINPILEKVEIIKNIFSFSFDGVGGAENEIFYSCNNCQAKGEIEFYTTLNGMEIETKSSN